MYFLNNLYYFINYLFFYKTLFQAPIVHDGKHLILVLAGAQSSQCFLSCTGLTLSKFRMFPFLTFPLVWCLHSGAAAAAAEYYPGMHVGGRKAEASGCKSFFFQ